MCDEHLTLCLEGKGKPVATDNCCKAKFVKLWVAILYQMSSSMNICALSLVTGQASEMRALRGDARQPAILRQVVTARLCSKTRIR
jgi:hypothetical protein